MDAIFFDRDIAADSCVYSCSGQKSHGSVLVMVLWILVIISFLSSEYIAHNREKTAIVLHTTQVFQRDAAAFSILELFASAQYDLLKTKSQEENADFDSDKVIDGLSSKSNKDKNNKNKTGEEAANTQNYIQNSTDSWIRLRPGGVEVWVKIENESSRTQLTLGQEQSIRTTLQNFYGGEQIPASDTFADALLDWLDPDDMVRLNGAEKAYYNENYPPCDPGNGPFKSMAQIFLVKGFRSEFFWGDPYQYILELPIYAELKENYELNPKSHTKFSKNRRDSEIPDNGQMQTILDQFTIYSKDHIRVSMLFPGEGDTWYNEIFWVKREGKSFKLAEQLSRSMVARMNPYKN